MILEIVEGTPAWIEDAFFSVALIMTLISEIFKASFTVAKLAFDPEGKTDPVIIEFHSGLPTDFQNVLLANSITLTPGTFTLIQEGDRFVVHCLRREYANGMGDSKFIELLRRVK